MKGKEESEKVGLKLNIQKTKIMASGPITPWQIHGETMTDFNLGGSKISADGYHSCEIKRCLLLGRKKSLSRVWLFATPWTVAYQASPSMEFSRQEYWSGLLFPIPGNLPDPRIECMSLVSPVLKADSLPLSHLGSPSKCTIKYLILNTL